MAVKMKANSIFTDVSGSTHYPRAVVDYIQYLASQSVTDDPTNQRQEDFRNGWLVAYSILLERPTINELVEAAQGLLNRLDVMTIDQYALGAEKDERERLEAAIAKAKE